MNESEMAQIRGEVTKGFNPKAMDALGGDGWQSFRQSLPEGAVTVSSSALQIDPMTFLRSVADKTATTGNKSEKAKSEKGGLVEAPAEEDDKEKAKMFASIRRERLQLKSMLTRSTAAHKTHLNASVVAASKAVEAADPEKDKEWTAILVENLCVVHAFLGNNFNVSDRTHVEYKWNDLADSELKSPTLTPKHADGEVPAVYEWARKVGEELADWHSRCQTILLQHVLMNVEAPPIESPCTFIGLCALEERLAATQKITTEQELETEKTALEGIIQQMSQLNAEMKKAIKDVTNCKAKRDSDQAKTSEKKEVEWRPSFRRRSFARAWKARPSSSV
jgi:hypothetical protein